MRPPRNPSAPHLRAPLIFVALVALSMIVVTAVSAAPKLKLPDGVSRDLAYTMYGEQVDSAGSIGDLVDGRVSEFEVLRTAVTTPSATLDLRVTYSNGTARRGVMNLVSAGDVWYFESIARTGATWDPGYVTNPDIGVLNTMLAEQAKSTDMINQLVDGTFDNVAVGTPKKGFRSTTIPVTFSGSGETAEGSVTAVRRTQDGRPQWFVVSFR